MEGEGGEGGRDGGEGGWRERVKGEGGGGEKRGDTCKEGGRWW